MKTVTDITPVLEFLTCPTPSAWVDWALENPDILLIDHANCEKKAASTALNLLYRYVEHYSLLNRRGDMSTDLQRQIRTY